MDPDFLHAINGDWDALLTALRDARALARRMDDSGMTVLHWVCMHQSAPTDIIVKVIFANPHAVHVRNDAGHLPIDLAIQAECGERILEVLRAAANGSRDRGRSAADLQLYDEEDADPSMEVSEYQLPFGDNNRRHQSILDDVHEYQPQQPGRYYDDADDDEEFAYYHQLQQQQRQQQREQQQREQQYQQMQRFQFEQQQEMGRNQRAMSRDRLIMSNHSSPAPSPSPHQPYPKFYSPRDGPYPGYGNGNGNGNGQANGRGSMSNASHRSDHMKALSLTEQRLRERENDLISVATADDNTPIAFDSHQTHDLTMFGGFGHPPRELENDPRGIPNIAANHNMNSISNNINQYGGNGGSANRPRAKTTFPPRWRQARSCDVCASVFSLMKRRHHCRNCGQSVCSQHSTNRVSLPKFGLSEPQRVCDKCFLSGHHMSIGPPPGPPSTTESFQSHSQFMRAHYG